MESAFFRVLGIVLLLLLTPSCSKEKGEVKGGPGGQPVPVVTALVQQKNVPLIIHAMGNAESCLAVAVKSRVDGEILRAAILDGQEVQKGDLLFDLDDRPFQYRLKQLKANLDRDLALLENARAKEKRQDVLSKQNFASEETLVSLVTARQAAEATVAADRAALADGELQLAFTHILAPITGMVGRILIHPGNLIKANDANPLVSINQMDPMCIRFTVAESHLHAIRENHAKAPLTLELFPNRETSQPLPATLLSLDNVVDRQTGTLSLKAEAANANRRLWPGQFVTITLKLAERPAALVIPAQAVQTGVNGPFVYVVKDDNVVEARPVVLEQEGKEDTVITSGLTVGEVVVTVGQWRLKPGAKVEIIKAKQP
ncbi:MAG: efflux RND transporter periplasmic adaptor subunit [Magnetococcales bacterium]|nr:efflux RND transporter periplasmic adaptor subunit [Magnetococcales bacterium]